jgi:hypothetical protein
MIEESMYLDNPNKQDNIVPEDMADKDEQRIPDFTAKNKQPGPLHNNDVEDSKSKSIAKMLSKLDANITILNNLLERTTKARLELESLGNSATKNVSLAIKEQCYAEYKSIVTNAAANYVKLQKEANSWHQKMYAPYSFRANLLLVSAVITPILLLYLILKK